MSWSYGDSTSLLDQVRRLIGDTDTTDQLVTDEAINSELALNSNDPIQTAKKMCLQLAARFSRKAIQRSAGKYSEDYRQVAQAFRDLAKSIEEMASEPTESVAEQTFGDPQRPWDGSQEKDYVNRDALRNDL